MHVDAELLLAIGIVAFYLFDSAALLHFDDVLVAASRRNWRVTTGAQLEMRGRFLHVPNPLLPFHTALVASWLRPDHRRSDSPETLRTFGETLLPVRIGCSLVVVLMVMAMPALLLTTRDPVWMLCLLAATWTCTIAMLVFLSLRRGVLGLTGRNVAALAIETLLCPPCAPNLYRKLCQKRGFDGDPVLFAARHTTPDAQTRLRAEIEARIAMFALADEDAGGHITGIRAAQQRIRETLT